MSDDLHGVADTADKPPCALFPGALKEMICAINVVLTQCLFTLHVTTHHTKATAIWKKMMIRRGIAL